MAIPKPVVSAAPVPQEITQPGLWLRQSVQRRLTAAGVYLVLIGLSIIFLIPLAWMLSTALKSPGEVFIWPPQWIPEVLRWNNFTRVFASVPFRELHNQLAGHRRVEHRRQRRLVQLGGVCLRAAAFSGAQFSVWGSDCHADDPRHGVDHPQLHFVQEPGLVQHLFAADCAQLLRFGVLHFSAAPIHAHPAARLRRRRAH